MSNNDVVGESFAAKGCRTNTNNGGNKNYRELYLGDVVDIYLELGGNLNEIVKLVSNLSDYNEYWYLHLIKVISQDYSNEAIKSLKKALLHSETEENIRIEAAKNLADLGELQGFKFLTKFIRINKQSPYTINGHLSIQNVDTVSGLKEIEDLMYLVIDKNYKELHHFSESASNILIELLLGFAEKSEADLERVIHFCKKSMHALKKKGYENTTDFNFFINRMVENFRNSDKAVKNISDFKSIIQGLTY